MKGQHGMPLEEFVTRFPLEQPVLGMLNQLGYDRNDLPHSPYKTPDDRRVWRALHAVTSAFEKAGIDIQDIRDSMPIDEPSPSPAQKPRAWHERAAAILQEAIAAFNADPRLLRSALHAADDVVNLVTDKDG